MLRYSRPQAAYPGEWAFILCAKLVTATPAHERAERKREAETAGDGNEGLQELLEKAVEGEVTGTLGVCERYLTPLTAGRGTDWELGSCLRRTAHACL